MQVHATFRLRVGLLGVLCEACFRFEFAFADDDDPMPQGVAAKTDKQTSERKINWGADAKKYHLLRSNVLYYLRKWSTLTFWIALYLSFPKKIFLFLCSSVCHHLRQCRNQNGPDPPKIDSLKWVGNRAKWSSHFVYIRIMIKSCLTDIFSRDLSEQKEKKFSGRW